MTWARDSVGDWLLRYRIKASLSNNQEEIYTVSIPLKDSISVRALRQPFGWLFLYLMGFSNVPECGIFQCRLFTNERYTKGSHTGIGLWARFLSSGRDRREACEKRGFEWSGMGADCVRERGEI